MEARKRVPGANGESAAGKVWAVLGEELPPGSILEPVGLPALIENQSITQIPNIDPATLVEEFIFGAR